MYERIVTPREENPRPSMQRPFERAPPEMLPPGTRVRTRPSSPHNLTFREPRYDRPTELEDHGVLPSIEGPDGSSSSLQARRNPFDRYVEPQVVDHAREEGRTLRDADFSGLTNSQGASSKRRRLDEAPQLLEYRTVRRDSPGIVRERVYLPDTQPRSSYVQTRAVDHGEPRLSPQVRPAATAQDRARYVELQPLYDVRDYASPASNVHRSVSNQYDLREASRLQPRQSSHMYDPRGVHETGVRMHPREADQQSSMFVNRVYETVADSHPDNRIQYLPQDSQTRYIQHSGPPREGAGMPPRQRVFQYEDEPVTVSRSFAPVQH